MVETKEFKYRGKGVEELKKLSIEEFAKLLPSRARRKINRGFTEQENIFLDKLLKGESKLKTHCRDMIVLPVMIGKKIGIYSGKEFVDIKIVPEMLGLRFGELVPTRKIAKHTSIGAKRTVVRK